MKPITSNVVDRDNVIMVIKNQSSLVSDVAIRGLLKGLQKQITEHVKPVWGVECTLIAFDASVPVNPRAMAILVKDTSDDPGALGYHFSPDGLPTTEIFAKDDMADGAGIDGLSVTLSHEIIEMLVDPGVNIYAIGPGVINGRSQAVMYPYETCDPVQGNTYTCAGVRVSDFIVPEWFEAERGPGSMMMNYLGGLRSPFALAPGGYASMLYAGRWYDAWGETREKSPGRHRQAIRNAVLARVQGKPGPKAMDVAGKVASMRADALGGGPERE